MCADDENYLEFGIFAIFRVATLKVVPDAASLRREFRVSLGRKAILWIKCMQNDVMAGF